MTQWEKADDPELPTFAVANGQRKALIAKLRDGDKAEQRLADHLAKCRKHNSCNMLECPTCQRRKMLPKWRVPASLVKSMIGTKAPQTIYLDAIEVVGKRRPLNEEKVSVLVASMDQIGQQTPITVRREKKKVILVSGWHRLAAAKRLGWETIMVVEFCGGKIDARLWQLMENLCRAELTVVQYAEHIEELRTLIWIKGKGGQVAPPGGLQPKEAGIKKTAKALGVTREDVRRSKAIAGIPQKVKAAAIAANLDDNQRALLQIAREPTAGAQLQLIEEMIVRLRAERAGQATAAEEEVAGKIAALEADLAKDKGMREKLKAKVVTTRQRLRDLKDAPPEDEDDFVASPSTAAFQDQDVLAEVLVAAPSLNVENLVEQHAAAVEQLQQRIAQLEEQLASVPQTATLAEATSPPVADDLGILPFLDRHDTEAAFDDIRAAWNAAVQCRTAWSKTPEAARTRFAVECLGFPASLMYR